MSKNNGLDKKMNETNDKTDLIESVDFFLIQNKFWEIGEIHKKIGFIIETIKKLRICKDNECKMNKDAWKIQKMALNLRKKGYDSLIEAKNEIENEIEFNHFKEDYYKFVEECLKVLHEAWCNYSATITNEYHDERKLKGAERIINIINDNNFPIDANTQQGLQNTLNSVIGGAMDSVTDNPKVRKRQKQFKEKVKKLKKKRDDLK